MKRASTLALLALAILTVLLPPAHAQEMEKPPVVDTGLVVEEYEDVAYDQLQTRSPTGAMLRSMAFPGWGQLYNKKYLKAMIVFGGETFLVVQAVRYWGKTDEWFDRYTSTEDDALRFQYYNNEYLFHKDRRNLYLYFSGLAIFLSMVDAYVDAHLANFDIDITPPFDPENEGTVGLVFRWRF